MIFALLIVSIVLLILAGCGIPSGRWNLDWFGMAFLVAAMLLGGGFPGK